MSAIKKVIAIVVLVWIVGALIVNQNQCNADSHNCWSATDTTLDPGSMK